MAPPDPDDVPSSPGPDAEDDSDNMAEEKGERASSEDKSPSRAGNENNSKSNTKSNANDPSRPKRKKARRACFACQRAHLTCGDERPCNRCIKRGLQDQCHDGVRKKAKYLHDAPAEALIPGFASNYHVNGAHPMSNVPGATQINSHALSVSQPGSYYPQTSSAAYPQYTQMAHHGQMPPPMLQTPNIVGDYSNGSGIDPATQFQPNSNQQISPVQTIVTTMDQTPTLPSAGTGSFDGSFVDPNDPSLFNFNISDLNFVNHYGAMEFGMLGHMSGAVNTPDVDPISMGQSHQGSVSYDSTGLPSNFGYNQSFTPWQTVPDAGSRQNSTHYLWNLNNNAFAVKENAGSVTDASENSQGHDFNTGYSSSTVSPELPFTEQDENHLQDSVHSHSRNQKRKRPPFPNESSQSGPPKRPRRDTADIYAAVVGPYPYTQGFHNLIGFLHRRFSKAKVLRIAKALASIRPSFISCNKNLNYDDLIFMEKCFQRTLYEYDEFVHSYGTPTIIFRRTGEIAQVNKEFSLVTGWRESVLLGKEPNLNVNTGDANSGSQTGSTSKGSATPRMINQMHTEPGRPQPVLLAEVLDEDSVVQFYEDFAELAFGASRSSIIGAPCHLLRYRTKDDPGWGGEDQQQRAEDGKLIKKQQQSESKNEQLMAGEAEMNALGEGDGKLACSMCWTVKRDVFDIPMMVVMNFLPKI